ncbi:tetratricopeptide repeat protein, partial [Myxococcota bacterium]|nr:tetratricopeptide repeat protein [Myxococcota bacterium]
ERTFAPWFLAFSVFFGPTSLLASPLAQGQEIQQIANAVSAVGLKLKTLTEEYLTPQKIGGFRPFSERLTDAEILYLLGDYMRASLVLYEIVDHGEYRREHYYSKAVYLLAESLYQIKHNLAARNYFQQLVQLRDERHLKDAVLRLIQLADRTHHWEGLDEHVEVLRKRGPLPANILYIWSKSLIRGHKLSQAIEEAERVPSSHRLYPKARYLIGVAQVRKGDWQAALKTFAGLVALSDNYEDAVTIRHLAAMNRGRIFLEQGELGKSIDAYQDLPRSSPFFEEALYEVIWTFVRAAGKTEVQEERAGEYKKALNALEILLLSGEETPVLSEARLLIGGIFLRLGDYKNATIAFDDVIAHYSEIEAELQKLTKKKIDPIEYFEQIAGSTKSTTQLLPPLALKWVSSKSDLKRAQGVVSTLETGERWIRDANELVKKLLKVLNSDRRTAFFPVLREALISAIEVDAILITLSKRLLLVERRILGDKLDSKSAAELKTVLAERARLAPEFNKLPTEKSQIEGRMSRMHEKLRLVQTRAYRLRYDIDSMSAQMSALNVWVSTNKKSLSQEEQEIVRERIEQTARIIAELERMHHELTIDIENEQTFLSANTQEEIRKAKVRKEYTETLEREREILEKAGVNLVGSEASLIIRVKEQREALTRYYAALKSFRHRLDSIVEKKSVDLRSMVLREHGSLLRYAAEMVAVRNDADGVIGDVAMDSLKEVAAIFKEIVLRADVGIVDVAWALKEEKTKEITRRVNQQRRELQYLDREFHELLSE